MPDETVVATIDRVERHPTSGWFKIRTDRGSFDTKMAELAGEAVALQGEPVRIFFKEGVASGNINQHTGQPFPPPRYFNRAERLPAGANGGVPGVVEGGGGGYRKTAPEDAWRMALTSGSERAVQTLPLLPDGQRDFDSQKTIAIAWARFIFFTQMPDAPAQQMMLPPDPESRPPGDEYQPFAGAENVLREIPETMTPPPDDDIPFLDERTTPPPGLPVLRTTSPALS